MNFYKFGKFVNEAQTEERVLEIDGAIASESWFDDEITPKEFKAELNSGKGPLTVYINSPGGDVFAASEIYTALREYAGFVTVKIAGLAASAASVIAMAGDKVLMSPTAQLMIHNPSTFAWGQKDELEEAIRILDSIKESIINAYERKTGMSRVKLAHLMDEETWMDSNTALDYGFIDGIIGEANDETKEKAVTFRNSTKETAEKYMLKFVAKVKEAKKTGTPVNDLIKELNAKKYYK